MEVHHHAHTARKKWTHYLWEFIMLFLAVYSGFLAENIREHRIEHKREEKMMASFLLDLDKDSVIICKFQKRLTDHINGLNILMEALRKPLNTKNNIAWLYITYMKYGMTMQNISFSENVVSQLKFGGGLRLIKEDSVVSGFNEYEAVKKTLTIDAEEIKRLSIDIEEQQANRVFDLTSDAAILKLLDAPGFYLNSDSLMTVAMKDTLTVHMFDEGKILLFQNSIRSIKSLEFDFLHFLSSALIINRDLYYTIIKEYHLQ